MHLRSIEMVGFKSFANRTVVDLKDGFTAVVGPNGCGKSNIVDALRWCLGEMSAKSLRSKQMLDVIFAGSSSKPPLNLAEVTLTFDNSHRILPTDFTEVQVTRRIFRSGESEYFLNKTQCRLKDIRDLFLDTGIGEGYSILAQGEVDFVIAAKPEERRELFEEAAGISKYKARREEALRKLEKVELDLNRLHDVISLLKEQMDSLEAAAKKAQTFCKIKEELKNLEISDALYQNNILEEEFKLKGEKLKAFQDEIRKVTTQLDVAETNLTQHRVEKDAVEQELYQINSRIMELDSEIQLKDQAIATAQERELEFKENLNLATQTMERAGKELESAKSRFQNLEEELKKSGQRVEHLKENYAKDKEIWTKTQEARKELEHSKNKLSEKNFKLAQELSDLQNEKNRQGSLILRKEIEIASSKKELEKYGDEALRMKGDLSSLKERFQAIETQSSEIERVVLGYQNSLGIASRKESELRHQIEIVKESLLTTQTKLELLQENFQANPYRKGTSAILKENFPGLKGVVGLLFKYPENIAPWVEAVLGAKMNYLVFETVESAQNALHWLRENKTGRATCFILEKIPMVHMPQNPDGNHVIHLIQSPPELEKLKVLLFGSMVISGTFLYDASTIDGGAETSSNPSSEGGRSNASYVNQLVTQEQLKGDLERYQKELSLLESALATLSDEMQNAQSSNKENSSALEKQRLEKGHLENLMTRQLEEINLNDREIALLRGKTEGDLKEKEKSFSLSEEIESKIKLLLEAQKEIESERIKFESQIEEKLSQERNLELSAKESEVRLESFEELHRKSEDALSEWKKHEEDLSRQIESNSNESGRLKSQIEKMEGIQKRESEGLSELQSQKGEVTKQTESVLAKKSSLVDKEIQLQEEVQKLRETSLVTSQMTHELELELRSLELKKKNIADKLEEGYSLSLTNAQSQFETKPADTDALLKLRKRIETMSNSVNLEAPEQYKGLQERYQFLDTQVADLTKAKEDLQNAIRQINATTREQFRESFAKVRENFRAIYAQLFEGGVADLLFTDEENILETGIEILAQPPGKKLQNIALLSGGEKTLTAISLLFAFFMVRPSPICLLDEVDAPLDPANVNRYLKLLKSFSEKTQFLAVTHNPKTMENADILYGVTMEESGISKILSARLRKDLANQEKVNVELIAN